MIEHDPIDTGLWRAGCSVTGTSGSEGGPRKRTDSKDRQRASARPYDWRAGEVTIRGKGSATERLPLPHDVGEALVDYLRDGRSTSAGFREVFVAAKAPRRPLSPVTVTHVVGRACKRVGIEPVGAHRLRHTLASDLLRAGTPLAQIAPILRHASVTTTAIYAKVDRDALRSLARPWPLVGGAA